MLASVRAKPCFAFPHINVLLLLSHHKPHRRDAAGPAATPRDEGLEDFDAKVRVAEAKGSTGGAERQGGG